MPQTTIMIVDDEEELRENLKDLLEFKGYTVAAYCNGEEALQHYESVAPQLALLDIQLPGIDGIEVLKQIKHRTPNLPVVMVSASSVRGILALAEENGAARIILKPYTYTEMLQTVEELLQGQGGVC